MKKIVVLADWLPYISAALIGIAVASGHPLGVAASIAVPALAFSRHDQRSCAVVAMAYYLLALSPLLRLDDTFFGSQRYSAAAASLWILAGLILSLPYFILWTRHTLHRVWRIPIALLLTTIPPLGLIGIAAPLAAAGFLFPRTAWGGLLLTLIVAGMLCVWPVLTFASTALLVASSYIFYEPTPAPKGWQAIDTNLGEIIGPSHEPVSAMLTTRRIQELAINSPATVIIFPESVVAEWTSVTEDWWQDTFASLQSSGKTVLLGATISAPNDFDFSAELAALQPGSSISSASLAARSSMDAVQYRNVVLIRGATSGEFSQRVPVPVAMWKPFSESGVPLNLFGPATVVVAGHKTAIIICYEQLIAWPFLTAMIEQPSILVAVANQFWVKDTSIPRCQRTYATAWARLFDLPILFASNS